MSRFGSRSTAAALLLVLLVASAGCSASLGGDSDPGRETATVTPAPVPEERPGTDELAPGVGPDGVTNARWLVDAHLAALEETSYTARLSSRREAPNGSVRTQYDRVVRVESPETFHYELRSRTGDEQRIERWRDGETAYEATTENGTRSYRSLESPAPPTLVSRSELLRLFRTVPSSVTETTERNGTTVHRLVGGPRDLPPLSNVTYVATVTEEGLIRSYEVTYVVERPERRAAVTVEVTVEAVGETTVERPSWYDEAT